MSNYIDNDDDLFDYDPEQDSQKQSSSVNSDFTESVKDNFDSILTHNHQSDRNKLAIAFNISTQKFIESTNTESYNKSVRLVLDKLTNGDFTLLNLYHRLEMRIYRRMHFLSLFDELSTSDFPNNSIVKEVLEFLKVDFTDLYIKTCYQSTYNISLFTLSIDRAMYITLSNRLGIPVKQELFANPSDMDHDKIEVSLAEFEHSVLLNVYKSMMDNGLSEEISKLLGTNAKFLTHE